MSGRYGNRKRRSDESREPGENFPGAQKNEKATHAVAFLFALLRHQSAVVLRGYHQRERQLVPEIRGRDSGGLTPMQYLLRAAKTEDYASILALMTTVIRATADRAHQEDTIDNVAHNLEFWRNNSDRCVHFVAELNSSIVGVVLVKEFWNLCSLFVDVEHHRQGIGRALTRQAITACQGLSPVAAIYLNSSPFAFAFYTALGFGPRETNQPLHPGVQPMRYDFKG